MTSLESQIYNILIKTHHQIIHKSQFYYYNAQFNYIDFILITPNYYICIYTNYLHHNIENFITEVNIISIQLQIQCIGIYFNLFRLTSQQEKLFIDENNKNINWFYFINGADINKLLHKFLKRLYYYGIYCYDNDNDCIMIEK